MAAVAALVAQRAVAAAAAAAAAAVGMVQDRCPAKLPARKSGRGRSGGLSLKGMKGSSSYPSQSHSSKDTDDCAARIRHCLWLGLFSNPVGQLCIASDSG